MLSATSRSLLRASLVVAKQQPSQWVKRVNWNSSDASVSASTAEKTTSPSLIFPKEQKQQQQHENESENEKSEKSENISRAMSYYLEKLSERESIIKFKSDEYEIGKRHLARMMGEDPDSFSQKNIDQAIKYLLPSALFDSKARPFLKHPEDYYPKSKLAAFDKNGRPLHTLFYTGNHDFFHVIYELSQKYLKLLKLEDATKLIKAQLGNKNRQNQAMNDDFGTMIDLTGSVWISQKALMTKLNTKIDDFNYAKFVIMLEKLAEHPLSKHEEKYIDQFMVPFEPPIKLSDIPELQQDTEAQGGRKYQSARVTQRTAIVDLKLYEGTGKISINAGEKEGENFSILYFESMTHREQLLFPFKVVERVNKFDMEIVVNQGGMSCLAKAIRYAISKCLCSFVSSNDIEKLRLTGLLTKDGRMKERMKPGKAGARKRYAWKKR